MKGQVVNLNRERWLGLANLALDAAATLEASKAERLGAAAAAMATATPPATDKVAMTGCLAFRWACQHFGFADPAARPPLASAVSAYAWEIRRIFEHSSPPRSAVAMPVPSSVVEPDLPSWTARADIGG